MTTELFDMADCALLLSGKILITMYHSGKIEIKIIGYEIRDKQDNGKNRVERHKATALIFSWKAADRPPSAESVHKVQCRMRTYF